MAYHTGMSDAVNLPQDCLENIPLRDLDAVTASVHEVAAAQADSDASQERLESSLPSNVTAQVLSTEELDGVEVTQEGVNPGTHSPDRITHVERWQLSLSATQVGHSLLAFVGFLAMVCPQVVSMRLAQWTAEKDFRAVCQALMVMGPGIPWNPNTDFLTERKSRCW